MFKNVFRRRQYVIGPTQPPALPPVDCNAEISSAISSAISMFTCEDYDIAGSGEAYATALGVCDSVDPTCTDCITDVGAALDSQYVANACA